MRRLRVASVLFILICLWEISDASRDSNVTANVTVGILINLSGYQDKCGLQRFLAVLAAILHGHHRHATYCPSIKQLSSSASLVPHVNWEARDTEGRPSLSRIESYRWMEDRSKWRGRLVGVLGPTTSGSSRVVGQVLEIEGIPHLPWVASDTDVVGKKIYPFTFRTVASNALIAQAAASLIGSFGWSEFIAVSIPADSTSQDIFSDLYFQVTGLV
ncbi:unnamed protein product [Vitrella brassicaformis CCMP3155]|uniref:Receptor ligand binding region domain-containing protein n=1 Tax=Vitrella brassicaformis (strain CCMP3155) TaxID=1169540 RepID=A0A0G4GAE0_VITBC|nr:unnamed protein product [Vitrella brassicaformis CCMP3155]|eukprot:CEM25920.1 unnamed protein product [Vitrella brassicaformis CCMP3155]